MNDYIKSPGIADQNLSPVYPERMMVDFSAMSDRLVQARHRLRLINDGFFGEVPTQDRTHLGPEPAYPANVASWISKLFDDITLLEDQINRLY